MTRADMPGWKRRPTIHPSDRQAFDGTRLRRNELAKQDALLRVAGRTRQQPERRHVVGRLPAAVRGKRCELGGSRPDQGRLSGYLGCRSDRHRILGRSHRTEAADCVGHARSAAGHAVIGLGLAAPTCGLGSVLLGLGTAMVYPRCSRPSAMSLTPHGAPRRSASIDSGAISATRWAR